MERREAEEIADRLCQRFDEMYFEYMNKILDEIRQQEIQRNLARIAIEEAP